MLDPDFNVLSDHDDLLDLLSQTDPGTMLHRSCRRTLEGWAEMDDRSRERDVAILRRRYDVSCGRVFNP